MKKVTTFNDISKDDESTPQHLEGQTELTRGTYDGNDWNRCCLLLTAAATHELLLPPTHQESL